MNLHSLIPLTAALVNLVLTLFVLSSGWRSTLNRVYALWGASITVWNVGTACMFFVQSPEAALFWAHFLQFGVIFLPVSLYHLSLLIADVPPKRLLPLMYGIHGFLALLNFTPLFVSGVTQVHYAAGGNAFYTQGGPAFYVFCVTYTVLTLRTIVMLYSRMRTLPPLHRKRVQLLLISSAILIVFGNNDILPIIGFYKYPGTNIAVFPFGSVAAIGYGLLVGYSVLQHRLLTVQVTLSRIVAHVIRLTFLFVIGLAMLLTLALFEPKNTFNLYSLCTSLAVLLASAVAASLLFPRLFGSGAEELERRIVGDQFEYQDQIRAFIAASQRYKDTESLLRDFHDLLVRTFCISSYRLILLDETTGVFNIRSGHPDSVMAEQFPELNGASPIMKWLAASNSDYMAVNDYYARPGGSKLERDSRESIKHFGADFCFPVRSDDDIFGLLLLGEKSNKDPHTATDIMLMGSLVKSISLMINQARLKDQIMLGQELDLLGRMSRGMAHDLNNLLTPLWTMLQLANEGTPLEILKDDLMPLAMRNIETMRSYIREALFFSKNLRPNIQLGRLDVVVGQAVEMMREQMKRKNMEAIVKTAPDVLVEMDEVLIKRLIINLVSNALDASPEGAELRVELSRLAKSQAKRDWVRLSIIDRGEGIEEENLNRIFTPYYTTKDRGDENRGFGLGLSICRKIVHLHGGNLSVASKLKKGTTVNVDLPTSQSRIPSSNIIEVAK